MADDTTALALGDEHEVKRRVYKGHHLLHQLSDFPLRSQAQPFVAHVNQLPQIAGEEQGGLTGVGEDIPSVLVGNSNLLGQLVKLCDMIQHQAVILSLIHI